jgi:hypothetical protein
VRSWVIIAKTVGITTTSTIKSHNGTVARKCDTLGLRSQVT